MEIAKVEQEERLPAVAGLVGQIVREMEPLQQRFNDALWKASVTGEESHLESSGALDTQIRGILARPEPYARLREARASGGVADPQMQRQLDLLFYQFQPHQISVETIERMVRIEKALESRFNNFRPDLDGNRVTDNQLRQILRGSDDSSLRQRAWEAAKQIGAEAVPDLLELVRIRNAAALEVGFANYYSMILTLDELDEAELFALLEDLERGTRPLFEAYKGRLDQRLSRRFSLPVDALQPWHYGDPFFQEAPVAAIDLDRFYQNRSVVDLSRRFFDAIGFDIADILSRSDLLEKPGKNQHAFCMSVDKRDDIRVLCNIRSNEFWMGTMLHEFGHAIYDQAIDRSLPFLLRGPAHTLTTEASAMLFGRLSKNAAWLTRYLEVGADEARRVAEATAEAARDQLLVMTRWCLVMCHMERALYRDPAQDLDTLWWDLVERYQGVHRPDGRHAPDWASKIHLSTAPVYYHNYMLGEIMASQLQDTLLNRVLGGGADVAARYVASPEVGAYLTEHLYRPGKTFDWRETTRRATGEMLGPRAFVAELHRAG